MVATILRILTAEGLSNNQIYERLIQMIRYWYPSFRIERVDRSDSNNRAIRYHFFIHEEEHFSNYFAIDEKSLIWMLGELYDSLSEEIAVSGGLHPAQTTLDDCIDCS